MHEVRLVYYSESRLVAAGGSLLANLNDVQRASSRNNARHRITGALAFDDLWFLQALEGEREAVWSTFRAILADKRHAAVVLAACTPIEHRIFGAWAMRLAVPTHESDRTLDRFKVEGRLRPDLMSGDDIVGALGTLVLGGRPRSSRVGEVPGADLRPGAVAITP